MKALKQIGRLRGSGIQLLSRWQLEFTEAIDGSKVKLTISSCASYCASSAAGLQQCSQRFQTEASGEIFGTQGRQPTPKRTSAAVAAAAAAALLTCATSTALCESHGVQKGASKGHDDPSDFADVLTDDALWAKKTLAHNWTRVIDKLARDEEGLPQMLRSKISVPQIGMVGGQTSVIIPLRPGADLFAVMREVAFTASQVLNLSSPTGPGEQSDNRSEQAPAQTMVFQVTDDGFSLEDSDAKPLADDRLRVHVKSSEQRGGARPLAQLQFLKEGRLTDHDMYVIWTAMQAANRLDLNNLIRAPDEVVNLLQNEIYSMFPGSERLLSQLGGVLGDSVAGSDWLWRAQASDEGEEGSDHDFMPLLPPPPPQWQSSPEAAPPRGRGDSSPGTAEHDWGSDVAAQAVLKLQEMGCTVHPPGNKGSAEWGALKGYQQQKELIEEALLLPLQHPEVFQEVTKGTRSTPGSSRPRAVLFEGPPGTGKTTAARVLATQAAVPLVYVPLEALGSKWYGASEKLLASVFKASQQLDGAIVFFDEIDALATSREGDMHEATRKLLGVLLREMDGFDAAQNSIVIGATNRRDDLDPALLSRFDTCIAWPLPDEACRAVIMQSYAQQLSEADVACLAAATPGASGRDLRDIASRTERFWGAKIARQEIKAGSLPQLEHYLVAAEAQLQKKRSATNKHFAPPGTFRKLMHG